MSALTEPHPHCSVRTPQLTRVLGCRVDDRRLLIDFQEPSIDPWAITNAYSKYPPLCLKICQRGSRHLFEAVLQAGRLAECFT